MAEKYRLPGEFKYEDLISSKYFPIENLLKIQVMDLEPTAVAVASYPKTGTTLLQELVWLIQNNGDVERANKKANLNRVPLLDIAVDGVVQFPVFDALPQPRAFKTHAPYRFLPKSVREGRSKVVYIIRNPKDCLVSFYHFSTAHKLFGQVKDGSWNDFFEYFKANNYALFFGSPLVHMRDYWKHKDEDNVYIVFYEDLIKNRKEEIEKMAKFLEYDLDEATVNRIVNASAFDVMRVNPMTNMNYGFNALLDPSISPFLRKGVVGDWKNYFSKEQSDIVDRLVDEILAGTGIKFQYE